MGFSFRVNRGAESFSKKLFAKYIRNDYDEKLRAKQNDLKVKTQVNDRYADDQDFVIRSFGRHVKFCEESDTMTEKDEKQIDDEKDKPDDELVMNEMRKIADTILPMLKTEADYPTNHPELEEKVPILDMACWVEKTEVSAQGMDGQDIHMRCDGKNCLPIGKPKAKPLEIPKRGLEREARPSREVVEQVYFTFYSKSTKPKITMLENSAQSWQQKRTTLTQEIIRRLLATKKELSCHHKQNICNEFMQIFKIQDIQSGSEKKS